MVKQMCCRPWYAAAVFWAMSCPISAAESVCELTVSAGNHDRSNTPVCVVLPGLKASGAIALVDADGRSIPAQLTALGLAYGEAIGTSELHFILPSLKKGEAAKLTVTRADDGPAAGFSWKHADGEYAELSYGQRPVLRYMCKTFDETNLEETYKVYHHVYSPSGSRIVTKGGGGMYPHHRGLFFGYCNITYGDGKRADTWSGHKTPEVHTGFLGEEAGPVLGRQTAAIEWRDPVGKPFVNEKRELCVYNVPGGTLIEFTSQLTSAGGKVTLDGNAPHAGFHFRADQEVAEKTEKLSYYLRPDGKGAPGKAVASAMDLAWDALSFVLGDHRYTAAYLDNPANPKPTEYNERTYGRFGSFFRHELSEGEVLQIRYRIWLQDGEMTVEQAAALSADFVEPVEVSVR